MSLKVSRILHAGYLFDCEGAKIAFDPIFENPFSRNCYAFPKVQFDIEKIKTLDLDAVFISHFHDDHCSLESLGLLKRETPIYIYCLHEELFGWLHEMGFQHVSPLKIDQSVKIGPFEVLPRRALDADVDSVLHVKVQGLNILNVVDSWIDGEVFQDLQKTKWDLVLWPFQTMREMEVIAPDRAADSPVEIPLEWKEQLKTLKPRFVVPSSCQFRFEDWSWYNHAFFPISYARFEKEMGPTVRLDPGASVELTEIDLQAASPLDWILPIGSQGIDYDFRPELPPPSTSEIAKMFAPLSPQQVQRVHEFCGSVLIQRYQKIGPSNDSYFQKERFWKLSVFDSQGLAKDFCYRLQDENISRVDSLPKDPDWTTEVPEARIYGALFEGESLTSMYIRVQGSKYADVIDDPLIRCLYDGDFGAYQKAQLKRLLRTESADTEPQGRNKS